MSQLLCAIPTCRIPGQHQDDCDQADCRGCLPRLAEDGWCCDSCVGHLHQLLGVIAGLAPDARAVAAGQIRRGPSAGGGGKPTSRPPLDAGATDALDEITAGLAKIARDIATTRGLRSPTAPTESRRLPDPLGSLCSWLSGNLTWVRHATDDQGQPYAITVHAVIRENASKIRAIVNGPGARRYLGPCGAPTRATICPWGPDCEGDSCPRCSNSESCDGDVYGRPGATHATCRTCGHQIRQDERRVWIGDITRDRAYRAAHIADAHRINVKTIRSWADRGKLTAWWNHDGQLTEWTEPEQGESTTHRGPRLYVLGDVLNLATADAARREALREAREQAQTEPEMGA